MKKLVLSVFALCMVLAVSAQDSAKSLANQTVKLENKRAGGTLTEEQKTQIYDAYIVAFSKEEGDDRNEALGEALKVVRNVLTSEQMDARTEYLEKMRAKQSQ